MSSAITTRITAAVREGYIFKSPVALTIAAALTVAFTAAVALDDHHQTYKPWAEPHYSSVHGKDEANARAVRMLDRAARDLNSAPRK